jgi:hypothetical protein
MLNPAQYSKHIHRGGEDLSPLALRFTNALGGYKGVLKAFAVCS